MFLFKVGNDIDSGLHVLLSPTVACLNKAYNSNSSSSLGRFVSVFTASAAASNSYDESSDLLLSRSNITYIIHNTNCIRRFAFPSD